MTRNRPLHLLLVAVLMATVSLGRRPAGVGPRGGMRYGVDLGVACTASVGTVGGEVVIGTVPSDGSILLVKSIAEDGSDVDPLVHIGPPGDPGNAECVVGGLINDCQLPNGGGDQTVYVRDQGDDETGSFVIYVQKPRCPGAVRRRRDPAGVGRRRCRLDRRRRRRRVPGPDAGRGVAPVPVDLVRRRPDGLPPALRRERGTPLHDLPLHR